MLRRLVFGFGANAIGQAFTILIQISSLPIFLAFWDASTYGTWILISALPGYLGMADIGIVSVAGNKMTMALGRGDRGEAGRIFQSAQVFLAAVCVALAAILIPAALLWPAAQDITTDMRLALIALMGSVLVALYGGLADAVFKATDRYPLGTLLGQFARLSEWAGFMLGLLMFRSFAGVAAMGFLARTVMTCVMIFVGQRGQHGLRLGFRHADPIEFKAMLHPAISFMAFPLANALSFQGVTLVVGALAGPSAVAVFNAYRTLARVAVQLTSMFSLALWPEFAKLFGLGGFRAVSLVFWRSTWLGALIAVLFSPVLYILSPWLLNLWTHGRLPFEPDLMALLLAYAAVAGVWHVPRVFLMSTNQHIGLSCWSLAAGAMCVLLSWALGSRWGVTGVGAAMLLSEAFIAVLCIYLAYRCFVPARLTPLTRQA